MNSFARDFRDVWHGSNRTLYRIIILNSGVWILINLLNLFPLPPTQGQTFLGEYLMLPSSAMTALMRPWTILTSFFAHERFWHLFWNMVILYWFGQICTGLIGSRKFLGMYMLGGLAGGAIYLLVLNTIPYYQATAAIGALGASAAVNAILVGTATIAPDYRMHLLFLGEVKIKYIALVVVLLSLFGLTGANKGGEVAHLGGAFMGYLYVYKLRSGQDLARWLLQAMDWCGNLFSTTPRKSRIKVSYRKGSNSSDKGYASGYGPTSDEAPNQEVIDAILDKVNAVGYKNLSQEEKQILFRASKKK